MGGWSYDMVVPRSRKGVDIQILPAHVIISSANGSSDLNLTWHQEDPSDPRQAPTPDNKAGEAGVISE